MRIVRVPSLMRALLLAVVAAGSVLAAGCAQLPAASVNLKVLSDELFGPLPTVDTGAVFELSPAMKAYADRELSALAQMRDPRRALIEALYQKGRLRLDYDSSFTRTAAQAFDARSGNCLSLVIMTASFARYLGLPVSFQAVLTEDIYSRSGPLLVASGHVNLVLGAPVRRTFSRDDDETLVVDFMAQSDLRGQRTRPLDESTVVAMFLNNRAAELLALGQLSGAYAYARSALQLEPTYRNAVNTLGVIYNNAGHSAAAGASFRAVLAADPNHLGALTNLLGWHRRLGHHDEAATVAHRLEQLQPDPPFRLYAQGLEAMRNGDFARAQALFVRELRLQPFQDEVHFGLAQAYLRLGQAAAAERHLQLARDLSNTRTMHERYSAKLEQLRTQLR
jgi:Flp pilus assembly protein TadD